MKKFLLTLSLALGVLASVQAQTFSYTASVYTGTMTNVLTGPFKITQIVINSTTNAYAELVDDNTGTNLQYIIKQYTNTVSYLTNLLNLATNGTYGSYTYYTNIFGVPTTLTNSSGASPLVQVDNTNNVVGPTTNNLPTIIVSCTAAVPVTINNPNVTFYRGLSITNNSGGSSPIINITVTGIRL